MKNPTLADIQRYFRELPPGRIDQLQANAYIDDPTCPCCIGAHLAQVFETDIFTNLRTRNFRHYEHGRTALASRFRMSDAALDTMLEHLGATAIAPFGLDDWPVSASEVFAAITPELIAEYGGDYRE